MLRMWKDVQMAIIEESGNKKPAIKIQNYYFYICSHLGVQNCALKVITNKLVNCQKLIYNTSHGKDMLFAQLIT